MCVCLIGMLTGSLATATLSSVIFILTMGQCIIIIIVKSNNYYISAAYDVIIIQVIVFFL